MKALITGGTGFVGSNLSKKLKQDGYEVIILTRDIKKVAKEYKAISSLDQIEDNQNIDVIINLAGANISKRWTEGYKKELIESRVGTTKNVVDLIKRLSNKPKVFISASAVGYYGSQGDNMLIENSSFKDCFTHQLCNMWEQEAKKSIKLGVRLCIIRLGVVLGKNDGALKKMIPSFKLGLGGKIGDGKQYFSWVHIDDVVASYVFLINSSVSSGIYNLTSPNPVTNKIFTYNLSKKLNRPSIFTMPSFVIKTLFGQMGENILLEGQRVVPEKLTKEGFIFKYPLIDKSLENLL